MEATKLSSKGQIIIPKHIRTLLNWETGQELIIINMPDGVLLKSKKAFQPSTLDDVAGILEYKGKAKTLEEMQEAIDKGISESFYGSS